MEQQSNIEQQLNQILVSRFEVPPDKLVPQALLKDDLRLDSLDFVDMFVMMEKELGSAVSNVDFMKIQTLGDVYQMVGEAVRGGSSPTMSQ